MMPVETKLCRKCDSFKPATSYYRCANWKNPPCADCMTQASKLFKERYSEENKKPLTGVRQCRFCKKTLPKTDFSPRPYMAGGCEPNCRACVRKKEEINSHLLSGQLARKMRQAKIRAKAKGFDFDLNRAFLLSLWSEQKGLCQLTNMKIQTEDRGGYNCSSPFNVSIDRINSGLGYTKDNVRLTTVLANVARSNWPDSILSELAVSWLLQHSYELAKGSTAILGLECGFDKPAEPQSAGKMTARFTRSAKLRTRNKMAFGLSLEFMRNLWRQQRGRCCLTGCLFVDGGKTTEGGISPWGVSLDRIEPTAGYVPGNVRLVASIANFAMSRWGEEPVTRTAVELLKHQDYRVYDPTGQML